MKKRMIGNKNNGIALELKDSRLTIREFEAFEDYPKKVILFDEEIKALKEFLFDFELEEEL